MTSPSPKYLRPCVCCQNFQFTKMRWEERPLNLAMYKKKTEHEQCPRPRPQYIFILSGAFPCVVRTPKPRLTTIRSRRKGKQGTTAKHPSAPLCPTHFSPLYLDPTPSPALTSPPPPLPRVIVPIPPPLHFLPHHLRGHIEEEQEGEEHAKVPNELLPRVSAARCGG